MMTNEEVRANLPLLPLGEEEFIARSIVQFDGCWLCVGSALRWNGYADAPRRLVSRFGQRPVHRVIFLASGRQIDSGLVLDHLCRVRCCVNPAHLECATNRENIRRGVSLAAENARKTHCKRGHEFTEANTQRGIYRGRPKRECRTCRNIAKRNQYSAKEQ